MCLAHPRRVLLLFRPCRLIFVADKCIGDMLPKIMSSQRKECGSLLACALDDYYVCIDPKIQIQSPS